MRHIFQHKDNVPFLFYVLVCIILVSFSHHYPDTFNKPRYYAILTFKPVIELLSLPGYWLDNAYKNTVLHFNTLEENSYLLEENQSLKRWYQKSQILEQENAYLKELLGATKTDLASPLLVQPFTDANSPFSRSILIDAGSEDGIEKGQEVVNHRGLVGRIIQVFPNTSRVLLITDHTFRLPARILETRTRALIKGTNTPQMEIMLIENARAKAHSGMTVVTSGMGGAFVPNIPVGSIQKSGDQFIVIPDVDFSKLENLVVQRHGVKYILPPEDSSDE